jgi:hypothetical protein
MSLLVAALLLMICPVVAVPSTDSWLLLIDQTPVPAATTQPFPRLVEFRL